LRHSCRLLCLTTSVTTATRHIDNSDVVIIELCSALLSFKCFEKDFARTKSKFFSRKKKTAKSHWGKRGAVLYSHKSCTLNTYSRYIYTAMRSYIAQLTLVLLAALLVSAQQSCSDLNVKVTRVRAIQLYICCICIYRGIRLLAAT
jgi:hypothetical protein